MPTMSACVAATWSRDKASRRRRSSRFRGLRQTQVQPADEPVGVANQDQSSAVVTLDRLSLIDTRLALGADYESGGADDPSGDVRGECERREHRVVAITRHEAVQPLLTIEQI